MKMARLLLVMLLVFALTAPILAYAGTSWEWSPWKNVGSVRGRTSYVRAAFTAQIWFPPVWLGGRGEAKTSSNVDRIGVRAHVYQKNSGSSTWIWLDATDWAWRYNDNFVSAQKLKIKPQQGALYGKTRAYGSYKEGNATLSGVYVEEVNRI